MPPDLLVPLLLSFSSSICSATLPAQAARQLCADLEPDVWADDDPLAEDQPERVSQSVMRSSHIDHQGWNSNHGRVADPRRICAVDNLMDANLEPLFVASSGHRSQLWRIGSVDDWMKLRRRSHDGMSGRMKLGLQLLVSFFVTLILIELSPDQLRYGIAVPFLKDNLLTMGLLYVPFAMLVIVGSSNAVNLTDGLDGLAIVPVMIVAACFGLIAYLVGNSNFSAYLQINYVPGTGDLAVMGRADRCRTGFLWFNAPPAKVFMGDTGSLALGGGLVRLPLPPDTNLSSPLPAVVCRKRCR